MKVNTKQRKKARAGFKQAVGKEEMVNAMFHIIQVGKQALVNRPGFSGGFFI